MRAIIFETHATSRDNEAGLASGWFDVDLSEAGVRQAIELGERRRGSRLAAVHCSDLRRARRTAELAFAGVPVPILTDPRLRECDYGAFTCAASSVVERMRLERIRDPFPGGESYEKATRRVNTWLDEMRGAAGADPILVIGHRATWYALEHLLTGRPLEEVIAAPWQWRPGWTYALDQG